MREVQPEINLLVSPDPTRLVDQATHDAPAWQRQEPRKEGGPGDTGASRTDKEKR